MSNDAEDRDQQVDRDLDATFSRLEGGEPAPAPETPETPGLPEGADTACMALEAQVTELRTRLTLLEESQAVAVKERDAADEARRKLETTLKEFLSRFSTVREQQTGALKEVDKLRAALKQAQDNAGGLAGQLTAAQ